MKRWVFVIITILLSLLVHSIYVYGETQLSDEQLRAFHSAKTVKIVVEKSQIIRGILDFLDEAVALMKKDGKMYLTNFSWGQYSEEKSFEVVVRTLLNYAQVKVVESDDKDYDAVLKIIGHLQLRDRHFTARLPYSFSYHRAILSGTISFEIPGKSVYLKSFSGDCSSKGHFWTPFDCVFAESFMPAVMEMIGDIYSVAPLIAALKDSYPNIKEQAAEVLKKMTGEEFGTDPEKWQQWWEKNKANFQVK